MCGDLTCLRLIQITSLDGKKKMGGTGNKNPFTSLINPFSSDRPLYDTLYSYVSAAEKRRRKMDTYVNEQSLVGGGEWRESESG